MRRLPMGLTAGALALPLAALGLALASGCATTPPLELVQAREAAAAAADSEAARQATSALDEAEEALALAEQAFDDEGASPRTRDLAYVAQRKFQIALAEASLSQSIQTSQKERARLAQGASRLRQQDAQRFSELMERIYEEVHGPQKSAAELEQERQAREEQRRARDQAEARLQEQQQRMAAVAAEAAKDRARMAADKQRQEMVAALAEVGTVRYEPRGVVFVVPGGQLFSAGQQTLKPQGRATLKNVAQILAQGPDVRLVIEGHTDASGSQSFNQELSLRRAEVVGEFFIDQGLDRESILTVGMGETRPVATNDTRQGRAENRRIEIVLTGPVISQE